MNAGEATLPLRILTKHRTIDLVCENQICFSTNIEIHPHQQLTVRNEKNLWPVDRYVIIGAIHCCLNMYKQVGGHKNSKILWCFPWEIWPIDAGYLLPVEEVLRCFWGNRCRRLIVMTLMMTWVCTPAVHWGRGRRSCKVEQLRTSTTACNSNSTR